ncbi:hypothetical protein Acr_00g0082960 [Actinidia rufa]|uniref:Uncharacterized protein n=1 Tax=Actinidia rufa TaxID=165716 RepID=A0A7J0DUW2_9ERIC|nr:hypothetical protein Acr_00g0082960 [Actinidia rufa]
MHTKNKNKNKNKKHVDELPKGQKKLVLGSFAQGTGVGEGEAEWVAQGGGVVERVAEGGEVIGPVAGGGSIVARIHEVRAAREWKQEQQQELVEREYIEQSKVLEQIHRHQYRVGKVPEEEGEWPEGKVGQGRVTKVLRVAVR